MLVNNVYIINLERNSDRYLKCINMLSKLGGLFSQNTRFDAVDGSKIDDQQIYKLLTVSAMHSLYNNYHLDSDIRSKGGVGCYLSHCKIWEDILKNDYENVIVFEDDTYNVANYGEILQYLNNLPKDYDIAFLNYYNYKNITKQFDEFTDVNDFWCTSNDYTYFFTDSYVISKAGASKLLEKAMPISEQVDAYIHNIATLRPDFKRYFSKKKLFKQNGEFVSNIQSDCFKCKINRYNDFLTESEFIDLIGKMKVRETFISDYYNPVHDFDEETNYVNNQIIENFINNKFNINKNYDSYCTIKFIVLLLILIFIVKIK